jgi:ABC-type Mn2+/Zn2+ transport system permease subunit
MSFELFLTEPYFQRVLATALVVAATSGVIGVFLVQRGMALFGDGIAHMSFAGIALGFVAGWMPLGAAIMVASVGALAVQELQRRGWARSDAALGIVYTTSLAFGVVLVSSRGSVPVDVESYLFGNLLLAGAREFILAAVIAFVVAATVVLLWRPFVLLSFGEERARIQGLPARSLNTIFIILTALSVVASVRVVGVLLVSGLLIIPASAASRIARSMRQAVLLSILFATVSVVIGLAISAEFSLASGATITLSATAIFIATGLIRPAGS